MRRAAFALALTVPLALGVLPAGTSRADAGDRALCSEAPVGLSLFFQNGAISPIPLVGDAPRYIQELDITAEVTTSTDQGAQPLIDAGALGDLDWRGLELVEERWTQPGDGTWTHMRFYRGARWMEAPAQFLLVGVDAAGHHVGEPIRFDGGADAFWNEARDDGFVRRHDVRQIIAGCQAEGDCSNVGAYVVQGLVQGRQEQFPERQARPIPREAVALSLHWSADPTTPRTVAVSHAPASAYPYGYGFQPRLDIANPPANGKYYVPGEALSVRIGFYDGQGHQLNTPGSLPTYWQGNVLHDQGPGVAGVRYWDPTVNAVLYYALKHREANMVLEISGPTNRLRTPRGTVSLFDLFPPETVATTVATDGFSSTVMFIPAIGEIFAGPAAWSSPLSDVQTLHVPADALPGTYTLAIKARREWGGEAQSRGAVIDVQVGQAAPTTWAPQTGNCESCHEDRSALGIVNHGIADRRACFGCHVALSFEPDNSLAERVHSVHSRSFRFPADFDDCSTCHLTPPSGPAAGAYTGPYPDSGHPRH